MLNAYTACVCARARERVDVHNGHFSWLADASLDLQLLCPIPDSYMCVYVSVQRIPIYIYLYSEARAVCIRIIRVTKVRIYIQRYIG